MPLVATQLENKKLSGFAQNAVLSNEPRPTNSIWAHLKKMGSSASRIGNATLERNQTMIAY